MMPSLLALMPMLVIGFGALALMMTEVVADAKTGLSIGTAIVLLAAGAFAGAGWLAGPEHLGDASVLHMRVQGVADLLKAKVAANSGPFQAGQMVFLRAPAQAVLGFDGAGKAL